MNKKTFVWIAVAIIASGVGYLIVVDASKIKTAEEAGLSGLHIMPDGTTRLRDGSLLEGTSINEDGLVVLKNGRLVQPEDDLRGYPLLDLIPEEEVLQ